MLKQILVLLTVAVFSASAAGGLLGWTGALKVRFGVGPDYFYDIPMSLSEANDKGWTRTNRPDGPLKSLVLNCFTNKMVCALYDDTGYIAGFQVAFPAANYTNAVFDWETQGFTKWTPGDGQTYWAIQQYFVTEEFLATSQKDRLASRDSNKILQLDGIWVTGFNKELLKISNTYEGVKNSIFTKQACIPLMGRHYYYNMSASLPCTAETIYPWFPLVHSGELVATGLITFGKMPESSQRGARDFFERPDGTAVKLIVPRGPKCLYDLADNPGLVTMHIYYISHPVHLTCLFQ